MQISPKAHLQNARSLVSNLIGSLDYCIATDADPDVMDQQGDWIIGEIEHALSQVRQAKIQIAEKRLRGKLREKAA